MYHNDFTIPLEENKQRNYMKRKSVTSKLMLLSYRIFVLVGFTALLHVAAVRHVLHRLLVRDPHPLLGSRRHPLCKINLGKNIHHSHRQMQASETLSSRKYHHAAQEVLSSILLSRVDAQGVEDGGGGAG